MVETFFMRTVFFLYIIGGIHYKSEYRSGRERTVGLNCLLSRVKCADTCPSHCRVTHDDARESRLNSSSARLVSELITFLRVTMMKCSKRKEPLLLVF